MMRFSFEDLFLALIVVEQAELSRFCAITPGCYGLETNIADSRDVYE